MLWAFDGLSGVTAPAAIGGPFQLTDQTGQTVTDKNLKGRPTLIFFGFTHCPDVCPTALFEMSEVLRAMGKDADRRQRLFRLGRSGARHAGGDEGLPVQLRSAPERPDRRSARRWRKVMSAYRVYAKKVPLKDGDYTMDHTALIYLMDATAVSSRRSTSSARRKKPPRI